MKIDDEQQLVELEGIIRTSGCREVVVEQYVETKYDVHLQVNFLQPTIVVARRSLWLLLLNFFNFFGL